MRQPSFQMALGLLDGRSRGNASQLKRRYDRANLTMATGYRYISRKIMLSTRSYAHVNCHRDCHGQEAETKTETATAELDSTKDSKRSHLGRGSDLCACRSWPAASFFRGTAARISKASLLIEPWDTRSNYFCRYCCRRQWKQQQSPCTGFTGGRHSWAEQQTDG